MSAFIEVLEIVFFGVLMFSIIVTIHEAGHFTAARLFGLRVKEFMLGLPGPNIGFTFKGTKFGVTPLLLGGYALIAGEGSTKENIHLPAAFAYLAQHGKLEEDEVRRAESELGFDLEEALDILDAWGTIKREKKKGRYCYYMPISDLAAFGEPREVVDADAHIAAERKLTFNAAPWYQRVIILASGVLFNLLFAIIVITAALMIVGTQTATTTLDSVVADSPAAQAGIVAGDTIVRFEDQDIDSWATFSAAIAEKKPGDRVELTIDHEGAKRDLSVTLADNEGRAMLGVLASTERQDVSFTEALSTSVGLIGMVAGWILKLFNPATFNEVVSQSTSVVGVSFEAKNAAESGFGPFIFLAAALSISIGLMNLLPVPPLDGGKIVVETIERITRRRIPIPVINGITIVALALLVLLFFVVTNQDIQNYIIKG